MSDAATLATLADFNFTGGFPSRVDLAPSIVFLVLVSPPLPTTRHYPPSLFTAHAPELVANLSVRIQRPGSDMAYRRTPTPDDDSLPTYFDGTLSSGHAGSASMDGHRLSKLQHLSSHRRTHHDLHRLPIPMRLHDRPLEA